MKALILAAGYATRLYPITKEYPKPLLEVGGRPIIDYIIEKLSATENLNEIIVVTNSKFISNFKRWAQEHKTKKKIVLIDDLSKDHSDRRGAIGDIEFSIEKENIRDDLLVIGGDNLFDGSLQEFLKFAKSKKPMPVIGAYDIKHKEQATKYGVIKINHENIVVDFQEKPKMPESALIAMCLYYFPREKLGLISEYLNTKTDKPRPGTHGRGKHDATGYYIDWLTKKEKVGAFVFKGHWYDIGHHEFYNQAKEQYK